MNTLPYFLVEPPDLDITVSAGESITVILPRYRDDEGDTIRVEILSLRYGEINWVKYLGDRRVEYIPPETQAAEVIAMTCELYDTSNFARPYVYELTITNDKVANSESGIDFQFSINIQESIEQSQEPTKEILEITLDEATDTGGVTLTFSIEIFFRNDY